MKYNTGGRGNTPIINDRNMGKIGTMSQSYPVTTHGIFNNSIFQHDSKGKVADAYRVLTKEVLNNAEKRRKHQLEGVR